jgi:hypothetical protein
MNLLAKSAAAMLVAISLLVKPLFAQNQTEELSPVLPQDSLPFSLKIELAPFNLPQGLQAYASATYKGKWILLAGRTNGLHGFVSVGNNFPPLFQNTSVYVIDPLSGESWSRSLTEASSDLSQSEIDTLSTTASEFFQKGKTLYIVGGYGINTATGQMETKSTLTAINLKKLISWVINGNPTVKQSIRQVSDPLLQVAGGALFQANSHEPFLLMLGQNFSGLYRGDSNGIYTQQIRKFWLSDNGKQLFFYTDPYTKTFPDYRRRDLNIVPIIRKNKPAYVAFAGVFTLDTGVWTVPITVFSNGASEEPNPSAPDTFKQAMNQYNCATFGLYSKQCKEMYVVFCGGISYGFFSGGQFQTNSKIPFINQVTTIKIDKHGQFTQYLMNAEYPYITSTGSNPGSQLLFGAEAQFFRSPHLPIFRNGVIHLDSIPITPTLLGYIVGGIMSTQANTTVASDSTSSPYVFTVTLVPN